ncbi:MAG: ECF transporter S component [Ruminococcaceae bacterium]|nr:ECF transporter S component [Oscillospiraceae bacterium]
MDKMSSVKKLCICAICIALCCVLPMAFHAVGLGSQLSPMHIPPLLCGLLLGPVYGAVCGVVGPILASLTTGMPPMMRLLHMGPELCAYGLFAGLAMRFIRTHHMSLDLYISLIAAMLLGRVMGGLAQWLVVSLMGTGETFTLAIWATSYIVGTLPGAAAHLILIPMLVLVLEKARVIPVRYPKVKAE